MSELGDVFEQRSVLLFKRITNGGLGAKPPAAGRFFVIFWKKATVF